ncbi:MAG: hypothetical protein MI976_11720 [Pseudomonadales bacterium]|nr:hypothetical protein [Pseudomonadales bacterium]
MKTKKSQVPDTHESESTQSYSVDRANTVIGEKVFWGTDGDPSDNRHCVERTDIAPR